MAEITVSRRDIELFISRFHVTVRERGSATDHDVTLSAADFERLGGRRRSPEEFIRACFEFLLERGPKESIPPTFEVNAIGNHFPEFEQVIQGL